MKAWSVINDGECGYIVFAETRGKARSITMCYEGFEYVEYCDIDARRLPDLDGKKDYSCVLNWRQDARIYYEAGWFPIDGAPECECCGRFEYEEFPESYVTETEDGNLCAACITQRREEDTMRRVCCVCHGYYDENGLTGETWDGVEEVTHGYCPGCYEEAREMEEK